MIWAHEKILIINNIMIILFGVVDVVCCSIVIEFRALHMLGKHSTFELNPQPNNLRLIEFLLHLSKVFRISMFGHSYNIPMKQLRWVLPY